MKHKHTRLHSSIFSALAITSRAHDILLQRQLARFALIQILQGHAKLMGHILATTRSTRSTSSAATKKATATATKELGKEIFWVHATTAAALTVQSFLAVAVIDFTLLGVFYAQCARTREACSELQVKTTRTLM